MTLPDTLLIAGVDIQTVPGLVVEKFFGLHRDGPYRGSNITLPGRPGQVGVPKLRDAFTFDVGVVVLPAVGTANARADFCANLATLFARMTAGGLMTLTRRLSTVGGYADSTCNGEYAGGSAVDMLNPVSGRTVLTFSNLDGFWTPV